MHQMHQIFYMALIPLILCHKGEGYAYLMQLIVFICIQQSRSLGHHYNYLYHKCVTGWYYIYGGINIMKLTIDQFFTMKGTQAMRVALLLSFLVLFTKGKGISYKKNGQDDTRALPDRQVSKTIQV